MIEATQLCLFKDDEKFHITKPIRLIELFAGYGSQHLALTYLGAKVESWRICEWAVKSIQAYKDIHFSEDNTEYSKIRGLTRDEVIDYLCERGISSNYNEPMTRQQIARLSEDKVRKIYDNIVATHNLVSVTNAHAEDFCIEDRDKYTYMMTYSFPCQDLSIAGKQKGMAEGSGTRSGLLWEVQRILDECNGNLPHVLLMENVVQVHGKKNLADFRKWCEYLGSIGYKNFYQDLNSKEYGYSEPMPQNRNRCFMVSVLGNYTYEFPKPQTLRLRLKDILEDKVDEKYYLSQQIVDYFIANTEKQKEAGNGFKFEVRDGESVARSITTRSGARMDDNFIGMPTGDGVSFFDADLPNGKENDINGNEGTEKPLRIGNVYNEKYGSGYAGNVWDKEGISPALMTMAGGNRQPLIIGGMQKNQSIRTDGICTTLTSAMGMGGGYTPMVMTEPRLVGGIGEKNFGNQYRQGNRVYDSGTVAMALTAQPLGNVGGNSYLYKVDADEKKNHETVTVTTYKQRIRKLTPLECFRLMGVKDEDFEKVSAKQSNSSLYHLAGDSIVVNVLMAIFKEML